MSLLSHHLLVYLFWVRILLLGIPYCMKLCKSWLKKPKIILLQIFLNHVTFAWWVLTYGCWEESTLLFWFLIFWTTTRSLPCNHHLVWKIEHIWACIYEGKHELSTINTWVKCLLYISNMKVTIFQLWPLPYFLLFHVRCSDWQNLL